MMAQFPAMPLWTDARTARQMLSNDGWKSPDTYCNSFQEITNRPAIYLFFVTNESYQKGFVAYVGMSQNLKQRMSGHEILGELNLGKFWPMRWFKRTGVDRLRDAESKYIRRFNPPWNIIGKRRGVDLS